MPADQPSSADDSLLLVEIDPPLPCGIDACGQPARYARIERVERLQPLWLMLPICESHRRSLDAAPWQSPALGRSSAQATATAAD